MGPEFTTPLARVRPRSDPSRLPDPLAPLPAQRQSGPWCPRSAVRHISHRRFLATFPWSREPARTYLYRLRGPRAPRGAGGLQLRRADRKGERAVGHRGAGRAKAGGRLLLGAESHQRGVARWTAREGRVRLLVCSDPWRGLEEGAAISWEIQP